MTPLSQEKFTKVGFAFVCQDGEPRPFRSVGWSSIFTAEAMAIVETLSYIFTLRGNDFTIFSESHSVLAALKSFPNLLSKTYLIFHIRDQLYRLHKSGKKVKLYWVPAHRGIIGNELVDRAAKSASVIGRDTQLLVPLSDFRNLWKSRMRQEFHKWCVSSGREKGKEFFSVYYMQKPRPWFHEWDLNRRTIVSINRLRSGHHSLRASLFRFNIVPSAMCPCGSADETVNHVFLAMHPVC